MMKAETIKFINELLENEVKNREERMLRQIKFCESAPYEDFIKEYRAAYFAYDDFDDWRSGVESE